MDNRPRKPWTARRIHLWVSIALAVPMLLIAGSGILIGIRSISTLRVPASWLSAESVPDRLPMSAYAEASSGEIWIGNFLGLSKVADQGVTMIQQFSGQEIVGLAFAKDSSRPVIGTRMAIWIPTERGWKPELRGRVRQLFRLNDGRVMAIVGGRGELADGKPMVSADGVTWAPYETANNAQSRLPRLDNPKVPIQQLARELHSGAFFIGKGPGEIFWSITFGLILGLLAITGLWMWIKSERQKAGRHQHGKSVHD